MTEFVDLFQVLAADDFDDRRSSRKAVAIAVKRATTRFSGFLAAAEDKTDYEARIDLIDDELSDVVDEACEDMGHEGKDAVLATVRDQLTAAGGFCDECKSWKSGPKAGCTCGDGEGQKIEDEAADDRRARTAGARPLEGRGLRGPNAVVPTNTYREPQHGEPHPSAPNFGYDYYQGKYVPKDALGSAPYGQQPNGVQMGASVHTAEDNLGGKGAPSPKIDKRKWTPNNVKKDFDNDGGPHPTVHQDIMDTPDWTEDDFLAQTDAVTEHQDADKSWTGEMHHTDTWTGTKDQASPVTSVTGAIDPDRNPIADLVEYEYEGFVPAHQVEQAVTSHWQKQAAPVQAMVNPYGFHNGVNEFLAFLAGTPFAGIPAGSLMVDGRPYQASQDPLFLGSGNQPPMKAGEAVTVDYPHPQVLAKMVVPTIESGDGSKFLMKMEQLTQGGGAPQGAAPAAPQAPAPGAPPAQSFS